MPQTYNIEIPDVGYFERQVSCRVGCPVHTDSGGYVQAIAQGRYEDAYIIARQPNPFASICGRVCAAPCEAKCRRGAIDAAISIRALKRFVCERFGVESEDFDLGRVYPAPAREGPGDLRRRPQGGDRGGRPRRAVLRARTGADGLCSDGVRGAEPGGRDAGAGRAGIPVAARDHPGGNQGHRVARGGDSSTTAGWGATFPSRT